MDDIRADIDLEELLAQRFGFKGAVARVLLRQAPVGNNELATLFFDKQKNLMVFIESSAKLKLGDVRKILGRMNIKPLAYAPPRGKPRYFDEVARRKFSAMFPGKRFNSGEDLFYYRTLVPYSPALVYVAEIKDGFIKTYDASAYGSWRLAGRIEYKRSA